MMDFKTLLLDNRMVLFLILMVFWMGILVWFFETTLNKWTQIGVGVLCLSYMAFLLYLLFSW